MLFMRNICEMSISVAYHQDGDQVQGQKQELTYSSRVGLANGTGYGHLHMLVNRDHHGGGLICVRMWWLSRWGIGVAGRPVL